MSTIKIGGEIENFITAEDEKEVISAIKKYNPKLIIGCGSKILFNEGHIKGTFLKLGKKFTRIKVNNVELEAEAGILLKDLSETAYNYGLSGLEMICGVPATLGGAIAMNFGAFGAEIKDIVKKVMVIDLNGGSFWLENKEIGFRYRGSKILDNKLTVLRAVLELKKENKELILKKMKDNLKWRKEKQPNKPNFGSVFKNTKSGPAGLLIERAGLKGHSIGGAKIWENHANFIVNLGNAAFKDVIQLIELCRIKVKEIYNVDLELEVRIIE